jgi:hypothetical protein
VQQTYFCPGCSQRIKVLKKIKIELTTISTIAGNEHHYYFWSKQQNHEQQETKI